MSAFLVNDETITALLQAANGQYPGDGVYYRWHGETHYFGGNTAAIAQTLVDENYRSVNYRYNEKETPRTWRPRIVRDYKPVEIIKLCDCYSYQTCETPDWPETEAYAIIETLRERAIHRLPGYEAAPWGL